MSTNQFVIDTRALSEPACKFLDAVRAMVGTVYEPTRIRREASARAEAMVTLANADASVSDIAIRAAERLAESELRRQQNIESVTLKAAVQVQDPGTDETMDPDWLAKFRDECQDVSNQQAQQGWARILAGEYMKRGSFSVRALRQFALLTQDDARLFTMACSCVWDLGGVITPIHYSCLPQTMRPREGRHMKTIGLIDSFDYIGGYVSHVPARQELEYFGRRFVLHMRGKADPAPDGKFKLPTGGIDLTRVGKELFPVSGAVASEDYLQAVTKRFDQDGFALQPIQ